MRFVRRCDGDTQGTCGLFSCLRDRIEAGQTLLTVTFQGHFRCPASLREGQGEILGLDEAAQQRSARPCQVPVGERADQADRHLGPVKRLERRALVFVILDDAPGGFQVVANGNADTKRILQPFVGLVVAAERVWIPAREPVPITFQIPEVIRDVAKYDFDADWVGRRALIEISVVER